MASHPGGKTEVKAEADTIDYSKVTYSPMVPFPVKFNVQEHIERLRTYLDPNHADYQRPEQHVNIRAAIKLYEDGKLDGSGETHIVGGKVVSEEEMTKRKTWGWSERLGVQCAQKYSYHHGPFPPGFHAIRMLLRLTPGLGGDGSFTGIIAMNDTGSNLLTVFDHDMARLGNLDGYFGWEDFLPVINADGGVSYLPALAVQVQLVGSDDVPWSPWIDETAILRQDTVNALRLSGGKMRRTLFFGTPAGNAFVSVVTTKHGMFTLL